MLLLPLVLAHLRARLLYTLQITLEPVIVSALPLAACSATQFLQSTDLQGGDLIPTIAVPTSGYGERH